MVGEILLQIVGGLSKRVEQAPKDSIYFYDEKITNCTTELLHNVWGLVPGFSFRGGWGIW